jgi:hypothetical protein
MLEQLSSEYIAPLLQAAGLAKHRLIWNRRVDGLVHVVHIQASRWNDADECAFAISVGVSVAQVYRIVWGKELPKVVREEDCLPRFRYGYLPGAAIGKDVWWKLHGEADIERVGPEVARAIEEKCLPILDGCRSIQDVLVLAHDYDQWKQVAEKLEYAVLTCLAGQSDSGQFMLNALATDSKLKAWQDRILATRTRLREYLAD